MDFKSGNASFPPPPPLVQSGDDDIQCDNGTPEPPQAYLGIEVSFRIVITGLLALSGLFTNLVNVAMFHRQGFMSHSSVVSLTALAASDFFSCLFCVWAAVCGVLFHFFVTPRWPKEKKLVRMISVISVGFVASYIPSVVHVILYYVVWRLNEDFHWKEDVVVWNLVTCLQVLNASTNIFIYFHLSAQYREELLLCLEKKKKKK